MNNYRFKSDEGFQCPFCDRTFRVDDATHHIWNKCEATQDGTAIVKQVHHTLEETIFLVLTDYDGTSYKGVYLMETNQYNDITHLTNDKAHMDVLYSLLSAKVIDLDNQATELKMYMKIIGHTLVT